MPWPTADVIVGNPPFLGDKSMIGVLGEVMWNICARLTSAWYPMIAFLVLSFNWRAAFVIAGSIGIVLALIWWLFYDLPERQRLHITRGTGTHPGVAWKRSAA